MMNVRDCGILFSKISWVILRLCFSTVGQDSTIFGLVLTSSTTVKRMGHLGCSVWKEPMNTYRLEPPSIWNVISTLISVSKRKDNSELVTRRLQPHIYCGQYVMTWTLPFTGFFWPCTIISKSSKILIFLNPISETFSPYKLPKNSFVDLGEVSSVLLSEKKIFLTFFP